MFGLILEKGSRGVSTMGRGARNLIGNVAAFLYDPDQSWIAAERATRHTVRMEFTRVWPGWQLM